MATGTVKWFNPTKGYGFIQPQGGGGKDVFVHISAVEKAGLNTLNEGQVVEYEEVPKRAKHPLRISRFSADNRLNSHGNSRRTSPAGIIIAIAEMGQKSPSCCHAGEGRSGPSSRQSRHETGASPLVSRSRRSVHQSRFSASGHSRLCRGFCRNRRDVGLVGEQRNMAVVRKYLNRSRPSGLPKVVPD